MSTAALDKLASALDELRAQVAALSTRIAALEQPALNGGAALAAPPAGPAPAPAPAPEPVVELIPPDILLAISAAVAAYLGERARVRAVRLLSTSRWSQEGRVSIQASHRLNRI